MKQNDQAGDKAALFVLAGVLRAAAIAAGDPSSPEFGAAHAFDQAQAFLAEANKRGVSPKVLDAI